jgi:hypothetical protein
LYVLDAIAEHELAAQRAIRGVDLGIALGGSVFEPLTPRADDEELAVGQRLETGEGNGQLRERQRVRADPIVAEHRRPNRPTCP